MTREPGKRFVEFLQTQGHSVHCHLSADQALERLRSGTLSVDLALVA